MDYVIETQRLTKVYGAKKALDDVSIKVKRGEIYGLIGKNGAGKTTLMKILSGLARPSSGSFSLFGMQNDLTQTKRIGTLIESPALINNCSAYENLLRFSIVCGADKNKIPELLELVGLADVGKKKAGQFSLGMKQRLGLAIAMLSNPEILILDEPINGLDPAGIKEIREIIFKLNEQGVTFIISSHLLDELAKVATRFGILFEGKLVEEITADELQNRSSQRAKIVCDYATRALEILTGAFEGIKAEIYKDDIILSSHLDKTAEINKALVTAGVMVSQLKLSKKGYENYFLEKLG